MADKSSERQFLLVRVKEGEEELKEKDDEEMCEVWGRLPEELLEMVCEKLPLASHVRFRCVCKRWQKTLSSREFLRSWTARGPASAHRPIFLYDIPEGVYRREMARLLSLSQICNLDLSFLQVQVSDLWTCDKGLICFHTLRGLKEAEKQVCLCVCNPLTRTWRHLPPLPKPTRHSTRIAIAVDAGSFQVVVLCSDTLAHDTSGRLCVYSDGSRAWRSSGRGPLPFPPIYRTSMVVCGGVIYLFYLGEVMEVYKMEGDKEVALVRSVGARVPEGVHREHHRLVEHKGHVLLVAKQRSSFGIWQLEEEGSRWKLVSLLLEARWNRFLEDHWTAEVNKIELLAAVSIADSIFLTVAACPSLPAFVLLFHTLSSSWTLYHPSPLPSPHALLQPRWDLFI